ncbi:MAG: hypothetical protein ACI4GO_04675 [Hominenteromicrobium sp.]
MKRAFIGGMLSLLGTIWGMAVVLFVGNNMTSAWSTPPGRFLTTVAETGMTLPFAVAVFLGVLGLVIMGIEYFKKD